MLFSPRSVNTVCVYAYIYALGVLFAYRLASLFQMFVSPHQLSKPFPAQPPPVCGLAAYNSAPIDSHFAAMMDVLRYVGSTAERGITYGQSSVPVSIWCDANFAGCPDTRHSVSGWVPVVVCLGGAVS
jgi:hypothetical protein